MKGFGRILLGLLAAAALPACRGGASGDPFAVRIAQSPSLALDSGNAVVAWQDNSSGLQQIFIKSWTGSTFSETGGSASGSGISGSPFAAWFPSLAVDASGQPIVAWSDFGLGVPEIYVRRLVAGVWEEMDGSATGGGVSNLAESGYSYTPIIATGGTNTPVVAWQTLSAEDALWRLYVRQWNGTQWAELAGSGSSAPLAASALGLSPVVAVDPVTGFPTVAWHDFSTESLEIYLLQWDGTQWVELGGSSTGGGVSGTGAASSPVLALDPGGNPVVAWKDSSSGLNQIYLKAWDGVSWIELGGSASGVGVSGTNKIAESATLAVDSAGNPMVAWRDTSPTFAQIYLKQWNGSAWVQLANSAMGGGVSAAAVGNCARPSLSVDPGDLPVVSWMYATSARANIYLKRWNGAAWVEQGGSATGNGISN